MAVSGQVLDKSAAVRQSDPTVGRQLVELAGTLYVCPVGELEQLYVVKSARDYDARREDLHDSYEIVAAPPDIFERALRLQRDLAHHHGMWHRTSIPDLLIAETALHQDLGVVHVDGDFARIAEVHSRVARRLDSALDFLLI